MSHDERLLELISALVDGELSPDEQTRARQLLASDPNLRQYHDELMALRSQLHELPRYRLGDQFAERVLRHAEREMLTRPVTAGTQGSHQARTGGAHAVAAARGVRRAAIWLAIAAVAAGITLLVVVRPWRANAPVAQSSHGPTTVTSTAHHEQTDQPENQTSDDNISSAQSSISFSASNASASNAGLPTSTNKASAADPDSNDAGTSAPESSQTADNSETSSAADADLIAATESHDSQATHEDVALQMPMYALVFEVVLTSQGIQERTFEQALTRNGIHLRNAIGIDRSMEGPLLAHQYFGGIQPGDLPHDDLPEGADAIRDHLDMYFLVCTGPEFDALTADLSEQAGYVIATKLNMTSARSDMTLYEKIQELARQDSEQASHFVGAHPLVIEQQLRERLVVALRDPHAPQSPELPLPNPQDPAQPELTLEPVEQAAAMAEMQHMVLVVLRSADSVKPE